MNDNTHPGEGEHTEEQKPGKTASQLKFYTVVTIMSLLCLGFIWYIFSPAETNPAEGATGLNTTVPAATVKQTEDHKRKIYEAEQYKEKQRDKQKALDEISENFLSSGHSEKKDKPKPDPIRTSHATYQQINRQMSTFYQTPNEDPQLAELKQQVMELAAKVDEKEKSPRQADPMELIEKSYELAAKYYPGGGQAIKSVQPSEQMSATVKKPTVTVYRAADETTSTLAEPAALTLVDSTLAELSARTRKERN